MFRIKTLLRCVATVLILAAPTAALASRPGCVGKMWNPLMDLDFRLMGGIKIAGFSMMPAPSQLGEPAKHRTDPICACKDGLKSGVGIGVTFWMPSYINDVARQAGCLGFMGGLNILPGFASLSSGQEYSTHKPRTSGVTNMQIHWAYADVTAIAGKALFEKCNAMTAGGMKISYLTEPDFIWQNDVYSAIMTPQIAILAENALMSLVGCGFEGMANTLGGWVDSGLCAWQGTRMPYTANAIGADSAQVSNMDVTIKYLARAALMGTTMRTMGSDAICQPKYTPFYDPFQHRFQWSYPGKVSTRFNVNVLKWGLSIKDNGQGSMLSLSADAASLANVDSTVKVGSAYTEITGPMPPGQVQSSKPPSGNNLSLAESIVSRLPKPLNYPTREAGYMQVWEARQCCMMVLTVEDAIKSIVLNLATAGSAEVAQMAELYKTYETANKVYKAINNPIDAVLGGISAGIGAAFSGVADSVGEAASAAGSAISTAVSNLTR